MSRATLSTGTIQFSTEGSNDKPKGTKIEGGPMHIALLGDFSGRASRGLNDSENLAKRRIWEIDRDNFEDVFERLRPQLKLAIADQPIEFTDIDDLHPDYLYSRIGLFDRFRRLKKKLQSPATFAEAAAELETNESFESSVAKMTASAILQQGLQHGSQQEKSRAGATQEVQDDLLTDILANSQDHQTVSSEDGIKRLIKSIVSPYVQASADPRQDEYLAAVDQATSELMRKIMHASDFQALEACWRSVYLLIRRIETESQLKLFLVDVSREEIESDLAAHSVQDSAMYKLLVESNATAGGNHYAVLHGDFILEQDTLSVQLADAFAYMAHQINGTAILGAHSTLYGTENIGASTDVDDWTYPVTDNFSEPFKALQQQDYAAHLALVGPRFLLRLPYGKSTSPTEHFNFEELGEILSHNYYLWGTSGYLLTLLLAKSYTEQGWSFNLGDKYEVGNLPLHVATFQGESIVKPCAEQLLTDRAIEKMVAAGVMPAVSVKEKMSVIFPRYNSVALGRVIEGRWK